MVAGARKYLITLLSVFSLVLSSPAFAVDMMGAATFGAALNIGLNKVGDLIRQAREAGDDLLLGTGVEIQNAIISAQIAYKDSLDKTFKDIDSQQVKLITDLDNVIKTATTGAAREAHELLTNTQVIANTVPFATKIPQLAGYSPRFVVPDAESIRVDISGNFPFGFNKEHSPYLEIGSTVIKPVSFGTTSMTFVFPRTILGGAMQNSVESTTASLHIPWDASRWYHLFWTKVDYGVFGLEFALLPTTVGKITISHKVPGMSHEEAMRYSENFIFDSSNDDIEENRALSLTAKEINDGWRIVPNTATFQLVQHIEGVEGHDWYNMGYQTGNDTEVIWRTRTERKHAGSSGKIVWRIAARIARDVQVSKDVPEDVTLPWGSARIFNYDAGNWIIHWTRFDGTPIDINSTQIGNVFLQVNALSHSVQITAFKE